MDSISHYTGAIRKPLGGGLTMGVYFFEKSLSFPSPILCIVFKIFKLPQNFSPKLGYFQKNSEKFAKK